MHDFKIKSFQKLLRDFYRTDKRDLVWRRAESDGSFDPYKILVSEIMLQQTQVSRVEDYFKRFIDAFPTIQDLANAELVNVIKQWQGLGYNRRARYLRESAKMLMSDFDGVMPNTLDELVKLPGVGKNTAGAILAYAYNQPAIFIETNIRTVYIHHFFKNQAKVSDGEIEKLLIKTLLDLRKTSQKSGLSREDDMKLLPHRGEPIGSSKEETASYHLSGSSEIVGILRKSSLDLSRPKEFYWSLMDYGTYLKTVHKNTNHKSSHYVKQSVFSGSLRQLRGRVLRILSDGSVQKTVLQEDLGDERFDMVVTDLKKDKLINEVRGKLFIAG